MNSVKLVEKSNLSESLRKPKKYLGPYISHLINTPDKISSKNTRMSKCNRKIQDIRNNISFLHKNVMSN